MIQTWDEEEKNGWDPKIEEGTYSDYDLKKFRRMF